MNNFVVVIPACTKDAHLAKLMLEWMAELGQQPTHRCILALTANTPENVIAELEQLTAKVFTHWKTYRFSDDQSRFPWPIPHNSHFQKTARCLKRDLDGQPEQYWFWLEADCVPLHKDWLMVMEEQHQIAIKNGKKFTGALVSPPRPTSTPDHMTGNAIYPRNLAKHAPTALIIEKTAWDCGAAHEIIPQAFFTIKIQHVYGNETFPTWKDVERIVRTEAVLFHQSKDGTLIARLRERRIAEAHLAKRTFEHTSETIKPLVVRSGRKRSRRVTKGMAKEIWHAYHFGLNGQPPQTQVYLAQLHDVSLSQIGRVVANPRKFKYFPPRELADSIELKT